MTIFHRRGEHSTLDARDGSEEAEVRSEAAHQARYDAAHDRFGGMNLGADFFGWLVALASTALLTGIVGAVGAAVSQQVDISQTAAERQAGTIGLVAAGVFLLVSVIGYYAGGYVAGRMSRFDGGRQGLGVWLIGLVVMLLAAGAGALFGSQYNVLARVDLPQLPFSGGEISLGAAVTGILLLAVTLLAALAGGKVGRRYHRKVDDAEFGYANR